VFFNTESKRSTIKESAWKSIDYLPFVLFLLYECYGERNIAVVDGKKLNRQIKKIGKALKSAIGNVKKNLR